MLKFRAVRRLIKKISCLYKNRHYLYQTKQQQYEIINLNGFSIINYYSNLHYFKHC